MPLQTAPAHVTRRDNQLFPSRSRGFASDQPSPSLVFFPKRVKDIPLIANYAPDIQEERRDQLLPRILKGSARSCIGESTNTSVIPISHENPPLPEVGFPEQTIGTRDGLRFKAPVNRSPLSFEPSTRPSTLLVAVTWYWMTRRRASSVAHSAGSSTSIWGSAAYSSELQRQCIELSSGKFSPLGEPGRSLRCAALW